METILIMCAGVAVGATVFPAGLKKWNGRFQLLLTGLLIFTMGGSLGSVPAFWKSWGAWGWTAWFSPWRRRSSRWRWSGPLAAVSWKNGRRNKPWRSLH